MGALRLPHPRPWVLGSEGLKSCLAQLPWSMTVAFRFTQVDGFGAYSCLGLAPTSTVRIKKSWARTLWSTDTGTDAKAIVSLRQENFFFSKESDPLDFRWHIRP
jgi:hypothetical protein